MIIIVIAKFKIGKDNIFFILHRNYIELKFIHCTQIYLLNKCH